MKKKIISLLAVLVIAVSVVVGVSLTSNAADGDGLKNSAISLAENITLKLDVAIAAPTDGAYAKITLPGGAVDATQLVANAPKNGSNYVFFAEVAVKDLAKDVKIEICNADGSTLVAADTTSALAYCEAYTEGEFIDLVDALVAYGSAAEYYFDDSKTADYAFTANLSEVGDPVMTGTLPAGLAHRSATLILESETTIRHYFTLAEGNLIDNYTFFIDADGDGNYDSGERVTANKKVNADGSVVYYVDIEGITPNELNVSYTVGVKGRADGNTYTCKYGVFNYLKNMNTSSASVEMKNLISAIVNYNYEASVLEGKVKFNANGGSAVSDMTYKYGIETPIVAPTTLSGSVFVGWYDGNGVKYDSVPSGATGTLNLTAKWRTETHFTLNTINSSINVMNLVECADHGKAEFTDDNGVCTKCGYCTAANASTCWFYKGSGYVSNTDTLTCTICGKKLTSKATNIIGWGDNRFGFANGVTLTGGGRANLIAVSGGNQILATTFPKESSVYSTLFDANGNLLGDAKNNTVYFEMNVGRPTAAQIEEALGGKKFIQVEDSAAIFTPSDKATLAFRMGGGSSTYTSELFQVIGTGIKVGSTTINNVIPTDGTVRKITFALDFSAAVADTAADTIKVSAYDENGNLLGSGTGTTKSGVDISKYNVQQIGQLRLTNNGSILFSGYRMYTEYDAIVYPDDITLPAGAPTSHVHGTATKLPTPTKDGATFEGWYLDENYTKSIDAIPANMSGNVKVYAKWSNVIANEDFSDQTIDANIRNSVPTTDYVIEDGKFVWTPTQAWKTIYPDINNNIQNSDNTAFTIMMTVSKKADVNTAALELCTRFADASTGITSSLLKITPNNTVVSGVGSHKIADITEEGVKIILTIDFETRRVHFFNESGLIIYSFKMYIPSTHANMTAKELMRSLRSENGLRIDSQAAGGTTILDDIYVSAGYYFK